MTLYWIQLCDAWGCDNLTGYYYLRLDKCLEAAQVLVSLLGGTAFCWPVGGAS